MSPSLARSLASLLSLREIALWALIALLVWIPWPLGSNRPFPAALAALWTGVVLTILAVSMRREERRPVRVPLPVTLAAILFLGAMAWAVVQASSLLPPGWSHPVWATLAGTGIEVRPRLVVNAAALGDSLMLMATVAGVFWSSFVLGMRGHRGHRLVQAVVVITAFYALVGLIIGVTGWKPWSETIGGSIVTSTFVNRNHFATYANIGFLVAMASVFALPSGEMADDQEGSRRRGYWMRALVEPIERAPLRTVAMMLCLAGAFATLSRGGLLSLAVAVLVFFGLQRTAIARSPRRALGATVLLLILTATAFVLLAAPVLQRFDDLTSETDVLGSGRLAAWGNTVSLILSSPWGGHGLGVYEDLFRMFADERFVAIVDHAHNDYLEILVELGVPGGLAVITAIAMLALYCAGLTASADRLQRRAAMAALLCSVAVGIHAAVDFSLTIPAVSVTFAAILGVGAAQGARASGVRRRGSHAGIGDTRGDDAAARTERIARSRDGAEVTPLD